LQVTTVMNVAVASAGASGCSFLLGNCAGVFVARSARLFILRCHCVALIRTSNTRPP